MAGGGSTYASSGRGGAGNFVDSTQSPRLQPEDLQTPTLKTPVVTTGRGGSGNMAKNVDPAETRARQDVQPWVFFFFWFFFNHNLFQVVAGRLTNNRVARRESYGAQHHSGRGGAGNFFKSSSSSNSDNDEEAAVTDHHHQEKPEGLAAKGKAFLLGKKEKSPQRN